MRRPVLQRDPEAPWLVGGCHGLLQVLSGRDVANYQRGMCWVACAAVALAGMFAGLAYIFG